MSQQYFIPTSPTSALSTSAKNIKLDLATEDDRKPDHFQEAMKHMFTNSDTSPAPNVGGTYTKTPSSDIYFEDNMHYAPYPPENFSFMAKTTK